MNKNLLQTLQELRSNGSTALAQLVAMLSQVCKQHEQQSKTFTNQLRVPLLMQASALAVKQSPVRRQRRALPDMAAASRGRQVQSRTAYIHQEIAVLDNIVSDQLSDVQVSEVYDDFHGGESLLGSDGDAIREGEFLTQQQEAETRQLLLSTDDTVRAGRDIENLEERIQMMQLEDQGLSLSGFKSVERYNQTKTRAKAPRFTLQFDEKTEITLSDRQTTFYQLRASENEFSLAQTGGSAMERYAERVAAMQEDAAVETTATQLQSAEILLESVNAGAPPPAELQLTSSVAERYGENFELRAKFAGCITQGFMEVLLRYRDGAVEIEQLDGDLLVRQV